MNGSLSSGYRQLYRDTSALANAESAKTKANLRGALATYRDLPPIPLVECPLCGKVGLPERIRTHECP